MRPIQPQRRRSAAGFWLGLLLIAAVAVGIIGALLWSAGMGPWSSTVEDPFMVRIPINARPIPAYRRTQREDLINPATGQVAFQKIPPALVVGMSISGISTDNTPVDGQVNNVKNVDGQVVFVVGDKEVFQSQSSELGGAFMNVNAIIGRVVRRDKNAGKGFQESTFFPRGTPEGIAGATPPGMRAITLDATKLNGVHALNSGNRLDLLASMPVDQDSSSPAGAGQSQNNADTEPVLLARNALLLRPVSIRNETSTTSSLTSGRRQVNEPKYEVTIAVEPDDVISLQGALDKQLTITCVATSMQPQTEEQKIAADEMANQLMAPVTVRNIPAYAVITREAFISPATRTINMQPVTQRQVDQLGLTLRIQDMLGSVARHDIPSKSFVRQSDILQQRSIQPQQEAPKPSLSSPTTNLELTSEQYNSDQSANDTWKLTSLPQQDNEKGANVVGVQPAVARLIPPGRVSVAVPWNMIYGAEYLQLEDRIDLLASYSLERFRNVRSTESRPDGTVIITESEELVERSTDRLRDETLARRGEPWFIATDAIVLGPVGFPGPNSANRAIQNQERIQTGTHDLSGPVIWLAIDSRDLESVTTVLNTQDFLLSAAVQPKSDEQPPAGFRRVAVAPNSMPAFSEFSDLEWKGLRRRITSRLVSVDDPQFKDAITVQEVDQYYGRVLKNAKDRFATFTANDFMPPGTAAGEAAGIGPGNVLFIVEQNPGFRVYGLGRFQDNDQVAIVLSRNVDLPSGIVVHGTSPLSPESVIIVQSARIVRESSDLTDSVALEVSAEDASKLSNAFAEQDSTGSDERHNARLMAIGLPRPAAALPPPPGAAARPLKDFSPFSEAPKIFEVTGGDSRLHVFDPALGES